MTTTTPHRGFRKADDGDDVEVTAVHDFGANWDALDQHGHVIGDVSGQIPLAQLGSGATDATTFLRGDGTWAAPAGPSTVVIQIAVTDPNGAAIATGDGKAYFTVPAFLNAYKLTSAQIGFVGASSSGIPLIQLANVTTAADMLTTRVSADVNERTSYTAAVPSVVDPTHQSVSTGDLLRVDCDAAGTNAVGLMVILSFSP